MKKILYAALFCCTSLLTPSCVDDLNQYPHLETTSENVYTSAENYYKVLAKIYTSMVTTGQEKGGGNADLSSNNGQDYIRCYFNLQEIGTDEVAYTWLSGENLTDISNLSWDANNSWVSDMYYRIYYNIALCNESCGTLRTKKSAVSVRTSKLQSVSIVQKHVSCGPCSTIMPWTCFTTFLS